MRLLFITFFTLLIISSCNSTNGKIEIRDKGCNGAKDAKRVFLINKSNSEKFKFTVKSVETIDDTIKEYSTSQITLEPGDEKDLGCNLFFSDSTYLVIDKIQVIDLDTSKIYKLDEKFYSKNELKPYAKMSKMAFDAYLEEAGAYLIPLYDTIINNQLHKYKKYKTFDTKVVSLKKHLLSYEVTGQVIINNQKH